MQKTKTMECIKYCTFCEENAQRCLTFLQSGHIIRVTLEALSTSGSMRGGPLSVHVFNRSRIAVRQSMQKHGHESISVAPGCFRAYGGILLDVLKKAAEEYRQFVGREYLITFSNGESIRLIFKAGNLKHLAGLNKLTDLDFISTEQRAQTLLNKALSGAITCDDLNYSRFFSSEAKERIESLARISEVLTHNGLAVYRFDRCICQARVSFKSDIIFFKADGHEFFITFGAAKDSTGDFYYPETIFYRFDKAYIAGQSIVSITDIKIAYPDKNLSGLKAGRITPRVLSAKM